MKGTGKSGKGRFWLTLALVMTLIVIAVTISTTIGAVNVSASDIGKILVNKMSGKDIFQIAWEGKTENIIWNIRFPRVLMAFIVGAGLSLCGVLMQALTKNPLADPYVLGISSGEMCIRDRYKDYETLGAIFQVQDVAAEKVQAMKDTLQKVKDTLGDEAYENPVTVFAYDSGEDAPFTACQGMPGDIIKLAGGISIFDDICLLYTSGRRLPAAPEYHSSVRSGSDE